MPIAVTPLDVQFEPDAPSWRKPGGRERRGAAPQPPEGGGIASGARHLTDEFLAGLDLGRIDPDEPDQLLPTAPGLHDDRVPVDDPSHRGFQETARLGRWRAGIPVEATGRHSCAGAETEDDRQPSDPRAQWRGHPAEYGICPDWRLWPFGLIRHFLDAPSPRPARRSDPCLPLGVVPVRHGQQALAVKAVRRARSPARFLRDPGS
jgi:hypothetical protein